MLKLLKLLQCILLSNFMVISAYRVPIEGYQQTGGSGYYPSEIGYRSQISGIDRPGFIGGGGYSGGFIGRSAGGIGIGGAEIGPRGGKFGLNNGMGFNEGVGYEVGLGGARIGSGQYVAPSFYQGGEIMNKNVFSSGQENSNDGRYENIQGKRGENINQGQEGYSQGNFGVKDVKGDNGYYSNVGGGKNLYEDRKQYHGAQHFGEEGKKGAEQNEQNGHKKGHTVKGYKSSHHKDESGKTEEYYDEENDEGGHLSFNGESGNFGKNGASSFKGGHEDDKFNSGEHQTGGHYDNEHIVDKSNESGGKYGENKYAENGEVYGYNNGVGEENVSGHEESSRIYKHLPHHGSFYYK